MSRVLVCGNLNMETTVSVPELPLAYMPSTARPGSLSQRPGGVGYNLARTLHALRHEVAFAAPVATDFLSDVLRSATEQAGLGSEYLCPVLGGTPQSVVLVAPDGQRQILTDLKDMMSCVYPEATFELALNTAELALMTNAPFTRPLLQPVLDAGIPVLTDLHAVNRLGNPYDAPYLAAATYLFASAERWPGEVLGLAEGLLAFSAARLVVLGSGERGALLLEREEDPQWIAALNAGQVVSTTGAGDVLAASFADGLLRKQPPVVALTQACLKAGRHVAGLPVEREP